MNIIFQYKATAVFTTDEQATIDKKAKYSQIPEMRVIDDFDANGNIVSRTIPYQSDVSDQATFDELKTLLETKGVVTIIGQWNDDGSLISYDINLYRDALNNVETFETAVFLDGQDYTGKEDTYVKEPLLDENGDNILDVDGDIILREPSRSEFVRVKSSKRPTLAQAKKTQVNIFTGANLREL